MTPEVIKTETTSLLPLSLNMNHALVYGSADTILMRGNPCLLLDTLALPFLAGTIEMQTEGYG